MMQQKAAQLAISGLETIIAINKTTVELSRFYRQEKVIKATEKIHEAYAAIELIKKELLED